MPDDPKGKPPGTPGHGKPGKPDRPPGPPDHDRPADPPRPPKKREVG